GGEDLSDAIREEKARVVEHLGRITAYAAEIGFFAHAVGETNQDLKALIGAASGYPGPGFLVPTRKVEARPDGGSLGNSAIGADRPSVCVGDGSKADKLCP